jgi:hypothetical protein
VVTEVANSLQKEVFFPFKIIYILQNSNDLIEFNFIKGTNVTIWRYGPSTQYFTRVLLIILQKLYYLVFCAFE